MSLERTLETTAKCAVCTQYVTALALALQNPAKYPPPWTKDQVRHERAVHGGYDRYYNQLTR